jgi:colanic acid biosynthesis glycosyl transferase WcaI
MTRVMFWSPNYAPELTGIPPLVTDAAEWLVAKQHRVSVITAFPNYPSRKIHPSYRRALWRQETLNGVRITRTWLRVRVRESFLDKALYELTFATVSFPFAAAEARRSEVVVCVVPSLLAAAYARLLKNAKSDVRLVLWIQDLVAEGAAALDPSAVQSRALAVARRIERFALQSADQVIVCSPGFREYVARHRLDQERVATVYNWADTEWIVPSVTREGSGPTRFLYAGNFGYSQGLETLIEAARRAGPTCEVRLVGDGNAAAAVREIASRVEEVSTEPPVPRDSYPRLLESADVHVVIQRRVSAGANLPSKIATALASGRPVIASIDPGTPAAHLLAESGAAVLVEPESPALLAEEMRRLASDVELRRELGQRARTFAEERLSKRAALTEFEHLVLG